MRQPDQLLIARHRWSVLSEIVERSVCGGVEILVALRPGREPEGKPCRVCFPDALVADVGTIIPKVSTPTRSWAKKKKAPEKGQMRLW